MTPDILARPQAAGRRHGFRLGGALMAWIERDTLRRHMRQLARLDDHLLRDIGVIRDDVRRFGL
jgi:uncharacterized protein YjiS (DUF1127 family)